MQSNFIELPVCSLSKPIENLFICDTAFQLFLAQKIAKQYQLLDCHVVIVNEPMPRKIDSTIDRKAWSTVNYFVHPTGGFLKNKMEVAKIVKRFGVIKTDSLYVSGFYKRLFKFLAVGINYKKLFFYDDGMDSISLMRTSNYSLYLSNFTFKDFAAGMLIFAGTGSLGMALNKKISFGKYFTIYPNGYTGSNEIEQISLKEDVEDKPVVKRAIIVGQNMYNELCMSYDEYIDMVKLTASRYPDMNICYCPHPNDSDEVVSVLSESMEICRSQYILEDFLCRQETVPEYIVGYYSTSLYNLRLLYKRPVVAAYFLPEKYIRKDKARIQSIYDSFEEAGIELINLD